MTRVPAVDTFYQHMIDWSVNVYIYRTVLYLTSQRLNRELARVISGVKMEYKVKSATQLVVSWSFEADRVSQLNYSA